MQGAVWLPNSELPCDLNLSADGIDLDVLTSFGDIILRHAECDGYSRDISEMR